MPLLQRFSDGLGRQRWTDNLTQAPYLPVSYSKGHDIITTLPAAQVFSSSGTTGSVVSRHLVHDLALYETSFLQGFEGAYGRTSERCILALLPSYLEREGSSLVYMVESLMKRSGHPDSQFYLNDHEGLHRKLIALEAAGQKTLLIGVTYALLDFAAAYPLPLRHTVVMETGGMKGRRREMVREEVHGLLREAFGIQSVHSEFGATELLSQAYSKGEGRYHPPLWMKALVRDETDPLQVRLPGEKPITGLLNIVDLANLYSCSFLATDDICRLHPDGSFEVLGRSDGSDVRGCSLLTA